MRRCTCTPDLLFTSRTLPVADLNGARGAPPPPPARAWLLPPAPQAECTALRAMVNCNVCHQRQKDVIITKCWHMFCQHCIRRNLGGSGATTLGGVQVAGWNEKDGRKHSGSPLPPPPTLSGILRLSILPACLPAAPHPTPPPPPRPLRRLAASQVPWLRHRLWPGGRQELLLHMKKMWAPPVPLIHQTLITVTSNLSDELADQQGGEPAAGSL